MRWPLPERVDVAVAHHSTMKVAPEFWADEARLTGEIRKESIRAARMESQPGPLALLPFPVARERKQAVSAW